MRNQLGEGMAVAQTLAPGVSAFNSQRLLSVIPADIPWDSSAHLPSSPETPGPG